VRRRWGAGEVIPLTDLVRGSLKDRQHGFTDVGCLPFRKPTREVIAVALDGWQQALGSRVVARYEHDDGSWTHFFVVLKDGGHLAVTMDRAHGTLACDLYPYERELDALLSACLVRVMPMARTLSFGREVPGLDTPTVARPR